MSDATDFLPIEEKIEWNLNAGAYEPAVAAQMRDVVARMKSMSESLSMYSAMVHRAMDERKLVLSQTQMLHAQIIQHKEQNFQLRRQLHAIGLCAINAATGADVTATAAPDPVPPVSGSSTASPAGQKLYLRIHYGDGVCPDDHFPYTALSRGVKKDKCGKEQTGVACPNCGAVFMDRIPGKGDGLQWHLSKFKCPKLKHLRPVLDSDETAGDAAGSGQQQPKKKKKKSQPQQQQQQQEELAQATASIENELDDLDVQISSGPKMSPSSMDNIMLILNEQ